VSDPFVEDAAHHPRSQSNLLMALRNMNTDIHELRTSDGFAAAYRTHARKTKQPEKPQQAQGTQNLQA